MDALAVAVKGGISGAHVRFAERNNFEVVLE